MTSLPFPAPTALGHITLPAAASADEGLVRQLVADQSDLAFRELYRRHADRMYRVALRLTGSDADAQDVIQESWVRALQRLDRFEGRSAFGTWLLGITVNVAREELQRSGRWRLMELDDQVAAPPHHHHDDDLDRAIGALPAGARAVFVLHDIEGFTHQEIAERFGWVAGTSKTQLFRARRALRAALGAHHEDMLP